MAEKEARARIRINQLLKEAEWRFFDLPDGKHKAKILLENHVKITRETTGTRGDDFEKTEHGFVDFLLLDERGFPFIVLEAKAEDKDPLFGKEQARQYTHAQHCRFIILSNGSSHYFWDTERGNPHLITRFPSPGAVGKVAAFKQNPDYLAAESVGTDYIALTQMPACARDPSWLDPALRDKFIEKNGLPFLRPYQLAAIQSIQNTVRQGKDRFLFEMATGTSKTLVAAAVIKLFLRTGNARRILLDTCKTFGCENGIPTFRYSLIDGVREGYLVNPLVVDARTDITTQLLSEEGYAVPMLNEE